jgi:hypothetical protein
MIFRTITPPPGSSISVATDGEAPVITIPQPSGGATRFLVGGFILFWLGGWFFGFTAEGGSSRRRYRISAHLRKTSRNPANEIIPPCR